MNRPALQFAVRTVAIYAGICVSGAFTLWAAIWLPTWALMHFAGWAFIDAYLAGLPTGIIVLCFAGIGVMAYRQKAHEP